MPLWVKRWRRRREGQHASACYAAKMNTKDGGRGLYWLDPDGHILEILTVPYGGWPNQASP